MHTFNDPVTDGDGGVVLDRRYYPSLGPDGGGEIPNGIVGEMCALLGPEVRKTYPNARCHTSKRGPKMLFGAPLKGQDPTVDLVVALDRRGADGLWIPHLVKKRWDASHPEQHVRLLNAEPLSLRRLRRRVIRLLKAWNKQWSDPAFSSFHLSVLALLYVESGMSVGTALRTVFEKAAKYLEGGDNTKDPAGVSLPIKLLLDRSVAVDRLQKAATNMARALDHDDDEQIVQTALNRVFRDYVDPPASDSLGSTVSGLRGVTGVGTALLGLAAQRQHRLHHAPRVRRASVAVKRSVPWQPPPWFVTFQAKLRFIREAQQVVESPVAVVKPSRKYRGGFAVSFAVTPHGVPSRTVRVEFGPGSPEVPRVFTDGPQESPHRYADDRAPRARLEVAM